MLASALHRHQLGWLSAAGWARVLARPWDEVAQACLAHWACHGLPLVVTQQRVAGSEVDHDHGPRPHDRIALGLPAPGRWERRRLALDVARAELVAFGEFPSAEQAAALLAPPAAAPWRALCADLRDGGAVAQVYGSHGWQLLTGLDHLRSDSDLDLWIAVSGPEQADAVAQRLHAAPAGLPRLDGELVFDDGAAVAWREWRAWRAGASARLLVKRLHGSALAGRAERHDAARCAVPIA